MFKNFSFDNCAVYETIWKKKNCTDGQAADENMVHVNCMMYT
jgi:hypothetical protein